MSFSFFFFIIQYNVMPSSSWISSLILFAGCESSKDCNRWDDDGVVEYDEDIDHRCCLFLFLKSKSRKSTLTNGPHSHNRQIELRFSEFIRLATVLRLDWSAKIHVVHPLLAQKKCAFLRLLHHSSTIFEFFHSVPCTSNRRVHYNNIVMDGIGQRPNH